MGLGWTSFPNLADFRDIYSSGNTVWLAALSGLLRIDRVSGKWVTLTESDGLGNNNTVSLTAQGDWLWIGTQGGVSRYDRLSGEWRVYSTEDGLSSNHDIHVYFDGDTVWAGTQNGLSWYSAETDRWESVFTVGDHILSNVDDLLGDREQLWISVAADTANPGGLFKLDKANGEWEAVSREGEGPPMSALTLTQSDELLWAIPASGLPWEYQKNTGAWRPLSEIAADGNLPEGSYLGAQFYEGALWLFAAHTGELVRYDPGSKQATYIPAEPLSALGLQGEILGRGDTLWFPGRNGLLTFHLETGRWSSPLPEMNAIYRILGTRDGTLLVNSNIGPGFWNPDTGELQTIMPAGEQLDPSLVQGAALEKGAQSIWIAEALPEEPGGEAAPRLLHFIDAGVAPQPFELTPPSNWTIVLLLPQSIGGTLWFVGDRGFLSYNPAVNQWGVFEVASGPFQVRQVQQKENIVWFLTDSDLGKFDTNTGELSLIALPVPPYSLVTLAVGAEAVWLLADRFLYWSVPGLTEWTQVNSTAPCLVNASQLAFWNGALWMGGANGVGRVQPPASAWECFTPADGLLDAEFEQIVAANDALWFANPQRGLWRYRE